MVVNIIPPLATFRRLFNSSREVACIGSCLKISEQEENVLKSWSSRSFLSVKTTIVGLFKALTNLAA